jgi:hypothetical protein
VFPAAPGFPRVMDVMLLGTFFALPCSAHHINMRFVLLSF